MIGLGVPDAQHRTPEMIRPAVIIGALKAALFVVVGLALMRRSGGGPAGGVLLVIVGAAQAVWTWGASRACVRIGERGIVVVNPLRRRSLAWSEIERFTLGRHDIATRQGIVRLCDGSRVAVWAIQGPASLEQKQGAYGSAEREIDALNELLDAARRAPDAAPGAVRDVAPA